MGTATVVLWSATPDFEQGQPQKVAVYLRDYDGDTRAEIGYGMLYEEDWQEGLTSWV
ncbi:hypothetical protein ACFLYL_03360 [Chloroflexota bacterium]